MTDLTSLGYPQGYHLGISSVLWWIYIIVTLILGFGLYLNAKKSDLINVKEILRAKAFFYIGTAIHLLMTQVGVFFPDTFLLFYFFGIFCTTLPATFYFHYWEKNLTSIKRIPTISSGASTIFTFISLILSIFFPDFPLFIWDFLNLIILSFLSLSFVLYVYLVYFFSKNVKGGHLTVVGWIWLSGIVIAIIVNYIEHPPGVKIIPEFILFYIAPILFICSFLLAFYGVTKLLPQISSFYNQTQKCAVHRGTIEKGTPIHYCSSCGIVYCETCFNKVIINDGCWNCRKGADIEEEKVKDSVQILESDKPDKPKVKSE